MDNIKNNIPNEDVQVVPLQGGYMGLTHSADDEIPDPLKNSESAEVILFFILVLCFFVAIALTPRPTRGQNKYSNEYTESEIQELDPMKGV